MNAMGFQEFFIRNINKRFGIGMMLGLLFWPLIGFISSMEAIVRNALLLESYVQLGFLTSVNSIAIFFCFAIQRRLNERHPGGWWQFAFGGSSKPWGKRLGVCAFCAAALTPATLAIWFGEDFSTSSFSHFFWSLATISIALAATWVGLLAVGLAKCKLFGSDASTKNYFPFESRDESGAGVIQNIIAKLKSLFANRFKGLKKFLFEVVELDTIDFQFFAYLLLLACLHWSSTYLLSESELWLTSAPSMVVMLIWIGGMSLAGIANVFDRFRLPIVIIGVLLLTIWQIQFGSTRDIKTLPDVSKNQFVTRIHEVTKAENDFLASMDDNRDRIQLIADETKELEDAAWNAIVKRMNDVETSGKKGKTLVVVTCPGGGIHAAAWSACVLDRISIEYPEFAKSICVISSVSGGSVGTLMFVSSRFQNALSGVRMTATPPPTTEEIHKEIRALSPALELAARSSLEPIAYGITADDLYGLITPWLSSSDRGQRLEDSLSLRLPKSQRDLTLGQWGDLANDGKIPIVIFNSTDAVTGRRVLFDSIPTPRRASSVGLSSRPYNYRELLRVNGIDAFDVTPATAARTSATFPYVSPFTKPENASRNGEAVALCDGGYVDNEGIVTAVNWIEFLLKNRLKRYQTNEEPPFNRILLLRIAPSHNADRNVTPNSNGPAGWFRWLSGPAETIVKVRSASQLERGNLESDLAELNLGLKKTEQTTLEENIRQALLLGNQNTAAIEQSKQQQKTIRHRKTQTAEENRKEWDLMVEELRNEVRSGETGRLQNPETSTENEPGQYAVPIESKTNYDLPVVVLTVRFENSDQVIPLNWKLSKKQKYWYLLSWSRCAAKGTFLRNTLDDLFKRQ